MKQPDTNLAKAIRELQNEVDQKITLLEALRKDYDPEEIDFYQYIKTQAWEEMRQKVFRRDGFRCVVCGEEKNLNVHHLTYENLGAEKVSDMITLCRTCHQGIHEGKTIEQLKREITYDRDDDMSYDELMCIAYAGSLDPETYNGLAEEDRMNPFFFEHLITQQFVAKFNDTGEFNASEFKHLETSFQKAKCQSNDNSRLDMYLNYWRKIAISNYTKEESRILEKFHGVNEQDREELRQELIRVSTVKNNMEAALGRL